MHNVVIGDAFKDFSLGVRPPDIRGIDNIGVMPRKALPRGDVLDKRRHPARLLKGIAYVEDFHV